MRKLLALYRIALLYKKCIDDHALDLFFFFVQVKFVVQDHRALCVSASSDPHTFR